ncbi:hypothetical protein GAMM_350028 [Gammaproteobacteria bacterium]
MSHLNSSFSAGCYTFFESLRQRFLLPHIALSPVCAIFLSNAVLAADVVIDNKNAATAPQLTQTDMGVPQINIVNPQDGLSHNRFEQYNVSTKGIIINNSPSGATVRGEGIISANRNLTEPAKTILFEVTGASRSELLGATTIAGDQAKFILANPNGITCDGCGFINTHDVELRTDRLHSITKGQVDWDKDLNGDIHIGKGGATVQDKSLILSSGKIKIEGAVSAKELLRAEAHAKTTKDKSVETDIKGKNEEYAIDVSTVSPISAGKVYLVATGEGAGVRISAPKFLINEADKVQTEVKTNKDDVYVETDGGDLSIATSIEVDGNFRFTGRNLKNHNSLKARNIELNLSGDFINEESGNIVAREGWVSTSKGFTNYQKMEIGNIFQVQADSFINDKGGRITAGSIGVYLVEKTGDGNSLYQGSNSILESREGGMELVAPKGGMYFGYKKELTGAGDNKDGFKFIGSQLLSRGGPIHIQSGGDVTFDGTQLLGDITVEAKGEVKENNPIVIDAYRDGIDSVVKKEEKERTVIDEVKKVRTVPIKVDAVRTIMKSETRTRPVTIRENKVHTVNKPVTKTREVFDHTEEWCPSGISIFGGCVGGPKHKDHYRTESYVEQVPTEESYVQESTIQESYTVQVPTEERYMKDSTKEEEYIDKVPRKEKYIEESTIQVPHFQNVAIKANFAGNKQFVANKGDIIFKTISTDRFESLYEYLKFSLEEPSFVRKFEQIEYHEEL